MNALAKQIFYYEYQKDIMKANQKLHMVLNLNSKL